MYVSRLSFSTLPGHTHEVEEKLKRLRDLVAQAGGQQPRLLHTHYASAGAPDLVFEEDVADPATLEREIQDVTHRQEFQRLSKEISGLLASSPKREAYLVVD